MLERRKESLLRTKLAKSLLVLLALSMVAAACSKKTAPPSGGSSQSGPSTITIGSDTATNKGTEDLSGKSTFAIKLANAGGQFYFEPTVLKGTAGQQVTLSLTNAGDTLHNFSLPDQSVDQDVEKGKSGSVQVTFPQSGFVEFFCKYHRSQGMAGELTVGS
jgi:plastocyanin